MGKGGQKIATMCYIINLLSILGCNYQGVASLTVMAKSLRRRHFIFDDAYSHRQHQILNQMTILHHRRLNFHHRHLGVIISHHYS